MTQHLRRSLGLSCVLTVGSLCGLGCGSVQPEPCSVTVAPTPTLPILNCPDVHGGRLIWPDVDSFYPSELLVLAFVQSGCAACEDSSSELVRLADAYTPRGVRFCWVYAQPELTSGEARDHAESRGWSGLTVMDPTLSLARRVEATVTPEVAVLSRHGQLLYRGRIDDARDEWSRRRPQPQHHDLATALDAALAGQPVPVPRTQPVGCDIDLPAARLRPIAAPLSAAPLSVAPLSAAPLTSQSRGRSSAAASANR